MKVSIITEGFENTGHGHITRCLALYQAFAEQNIYPTIYVNGDQHSRLLLINCQYEIIDWLTRPAKLVKEINNSDVLIIDSYIAGKDYYNNFSKLSALSLFIDDNLRIDYPDGIILNGTINSENFNYPNKDKNSFLLGSKYIPIRKEFWKVDKRIINQNVSSLLITFGGQDIKNLTMPVLNSIKQNFPSIKISVVFGNGFKVTDKVLLKEKNIDVFSSIPALKMRELMLKNDIVVTAAGQTLYELAVTGTPSIAVAVAENQKNNILEWKKTGFLIDPIFYGDANIFRKINDQIESLNSIRMRKKLCAIGKENIDGQGSRRVINYLIEKLCSENNFYLRNAVKADSNIVLNLSNDVSVRSQSINRNSISLEDHEKWFIEKINDKDYIFLLAFNKNNCFVGQIRFQIEDNSSIVSISLTKEYRGKGLSQKILKSACTKIFAERGNVSYITAYILPSNEISIRTFKSIGFIFEKEEIINNKVFFRFTLNRE